MEMKLNEEKQEVMPTIVAATSVTLQKEQTSNNTRYDVERAIINIDPEHLKYLRSLRPSKYPSDLTSVRFAQGLVGIPLRNYIVKYLDGMSVDVLRENANKYEELLKKTGMAPEDRELSERIQYYIHCLMSHLLPPEKFAPYLIPSTDIDKSGHLVMTSEKKIDDDLELTEIMRKHLVDANVVDLGAGFRDFEKASIMFNANRYTGIDINSCEEYGQPCDHSNNRTNAVFKVLGLPCNTKCEAINIDILEGLYTKIPDNSSCFVICGVDECYRIGGEYVKKVNELIAQKTKIGGIVIVRASILGHSLPGNFVEIYRDPHFGFSTFMGTRVYLRQS